MTKLGDNLKINSARLWGDINETAKFGGTEWVQPDQMDEVRFNNPGVCGTPSAPQ